MARTKLKLKSIATGTLPGALKIATENIPDSAITTAKIANDAVTTDKVENSLEKIVSQYKLENNLGLEKLQKVHKKEIITQLVEQGYLARKGAIT